MENTIGLLDTTMLIPRLNKINPASYPLDKSSSFYISVKGLHQDGCRISLLASKLGPCKEETIDAH